MSQDGVSDHSTFTLEQLCRALAAHALLSGHPELLQTFMAPETAETTAEIIHRFALGEPMARPRPKSEEQF